MSFNWNWKKKSNSNYGCERANIYAAKKHFVPKGANEEGTVIFFCWRQGRIKRKQQNGWSLFAGRESWTVTKRTNCSKLTIKFESFLLLLVQFNKLFQLIYEKSSSDGTSTVACSRMEVKCLDGVVCVCVVCAPQTISVPLFSYRFSSCLFHSCER